MQKITIVIPTYNAENYIEKCLDSCFSQTYANLEIIVIDDSSIDHTLQVISEYNDARMTIIKNKENLGQSSSRNRGIESSTGDYITFVDSDDYLDIDFCEVLLNSITKHNADISLGSIRRIRKDKIKVYPQGIGAWTDFASKLRIMFTTGVWGKLYSLDFLKKNALSFCNGRMWEDTLFILKALYYSDIICCEENTHYNYVQNFTSVIHSGSTDSKKIDDGFFIACEVFDFFQSKNCNAEERKLIIEILTKNLVILPQTNGLEYFAQFEEILGKNPTLSKIRRKYIKKSLFGSNHPSENKLQLIKAYFQ